MGITRYISNIVRHDRNTRALLREVHRRQEVAELELVKIRINQMRYFTQTCQEKGVTDEKMCDHEVIVSLTSFGQRIYDVYLAIESIMQGSIRPNRIVLWLSEEEFKNQPIPSTLLRQQRRGLEICFCKDIKSYKKLIYTLKQNPEACIITIDDDAIYEYDFVERMVHVHITNPTAVCACRMHRITLNEDGSPRKYLEWKHCEATPNPSPLNFPTGVGGVLYPPHCLDKEVLKEDAFMQLCPTADDVWFYAMARRHGTMAIKVPTTDPMGHCMELPSSHIDALYHTNICAKESPNDIQFKAVFDHYDLYQTLKTNP